MSYQPGIPTGTVPLNQDYLNLQQNFTQINTQFLVDHVPLTSTSGTPPNGYHEAIHMVPVSTTASNPPNNQPINGYTATAGYGQLFSAQIYDGINTDTAFYLLTGGNRLLQMTRNFVPVATNNGSTFLPGGLIMQWATATYSSGSVVVFPQPMTSCFSVVATFADATTQGFIGIVSQSGVGFTFKLRNSSNNSDLTSRPVNWIAIGI